METRTQRNRGRRLGAIVLLTGLLGIGLALPAAAQEQPAPVGDAVIPTMANAMDGAIDGLTVSALGGFGGDQRMSVAFTVENHTGQTLTLRVPRGSLFATEDKTTQVAVVSPAAADNATVTIIGEDPAVSASEGTTTFEFTAYCGQKGDHGPAEMEPMHPAGVAAEPLPAVLATAAFTRAGYETTQAAVWWLSDMPDLPVADPSVAALLAGVDTKAFAAEPEQVVRDPHYLPLWAREGGDVGPVTVFPDSTPGHGGPSLFPLVLLTLLVLGLIGVVVSSRRRWTPVTTPTATAATANPWARTPARPSGWYTDPWSSDQVRWWDGHQWTDHHRRRT